MKTLNYTNQKGQALLFVIVAMTIALSMGIAVSTRTVTSLRRTSSTDTSSRVFAAAEGGLEWFLTQPIDVLDALADGNTNGGADCPDGSTGDPTDTAACLLSYEPQSQDNIESNAKVKVSRFEFNDPTGNEHYWFNLDPGKVKEVALKDFFSGSYYRGNIDICWNSLESGQSALVYFFVYGENGIGDKTLVEPNGPLSSNINTTGAVARTGSRTGYNDCYTYNVAEDLDGLRIKVLYAPAKVAVFPASGSFPTQGFKITSLGQIDNVAEKVTFKRELTVYKSLPYASSVFDNSIYSQETLD